MQAVFRIFVYEITVVADEIGINIGKRAPELRSERLYARVKLLYERGIAFGVILAPFGVHGINGLHYYRGIGTIYADRRNYFADILKRRFGQMSARYVVAERRR